MTKRFFVVYAGWTALFAAVIGAGLSLQYLLEHARVGGDPLILPSLLRSAAPMASGSALLLVLVLWANPLEPRVLQGELAFALKGALVAAAPCYLLASLVAFVMCFFVSMAQIGQSWAGFQGWLAHVTAQDLGVGAKAMLLDTALISLLAWRYGPRLQAFRLSLPAKLIIVVTVTVPLRATVALIFASLSSA